MAKYSYEFKLQVVQAYLDGEGGYRYLSKKYGVPSKRDIEKWVFAYKAFGKDGLMRSRKNESYSFEFKLHVVELYLTTEVSYQELALSVGINNPPLIARWVNDHRIAGPDALKVKSKGRQKKLNKAKDKSPYKCTASLKTEYGAGNCYQTNCCPYKHPFHRWRRNQ